MTCTRKHYTPRNMLEDRLEINFSGLRKMSELELHISCIWHRFSWLFNSLLPNPRLTAHKQIGLINKQIWYCFFLFTVHTAAPHLVPLCSDKWITNCFECYSTHLYGVKLHTHPSSLSIYEMRDFILPIFNNEQLKQDTLLGGFYT